MDGTNFPGALLPLWPDWLGRMGGSAPHGIAREGDGFPQHRHVPDMVGQQQCEAGVEAPRGFGIQAAMGFHDEGEEAIGVLQPG